MNFYRKLVKHKTGYLCNSVFHNTNPALQCLYSVLATVSKYTEPHLHASANQNNQCFPWTETH